MKKLSKKQKLIGFIAIILIAVIIAIVITTSIIKKNNQIANEGYSVATANAGSSLISNYILNGITLGGITGKMEVLDTSDATATAEDIALGKTAYVDGVKITGTRIENGLGTVTGNETTNSEVNDKYGNPVKVPAGFKVVNPDDDVTKGIIIEDVSAGNENTKGSQFVWIPVGDVITDSNGSTTTITLGRYNFEEDGTKTLVQSAENYEDETQLKTSSTSSSYYQELLSTTSSTNTKAKDLEDFVTRVLSSGGYYIGRYEAGDAYALDSERTDSTSDTNPIVSKTGVYPYNYITQTQASSLCQGMYNSDTNNNFQSDLINSYAWDTAIVFIEEFSGDTDYSRQNKLQSTLAKCGEATDGTNNDVRCNIYDMAGNTREWNTETYVYNSTRYPCVARGGVFNTANFYTGVRTTNLTTHSTNLISFRSTLYL